MGGGEKNFRKGDGKVRDGDERRLSACTHVHRVSTRTYLAGCLTATLLSVLIAAKRREGLEEERNS